MRNEAPTHASMQRSPERMVLGKKPDTDGHALNDSMGMKCLKQANP